MSTHITKTWFDGEKLVTQEIAESEVYKQEPVAWLYRDSWGTLKLSQIMPPPIGAFPVYTTPPAAQRQPLTDEQIIDCWEKSTGRKLPSTGPSISQLIAYTRVVEAAHGITGENT